MPTYPSDLSDALRSLQRQIDQINFSRPGPMSWGPDDGHIRFYAADGRVLFQANSSGASVESRGGLTGLTPLLDSIRDKDDAQDGTLSSHGTRLGSAEGRLDGHDSTLATHGTRITNAETKNTAQDERLGTLDGHVTRLDGRIDNTWERANTARTHALTAIQDAATAQARADSAHDRIDGLNYASPGDISTLSNQIQALRSEVHTWIQQARVNNPDLPPPIPN